MPLRYILALVAAGVVYGILQPGRLTYAFGETTLYVFLPPLLFEAAWNLNYRAIRRQWLAIATLVGPGVIATALIIAGALTIVRVPFIVALLTGAILSATDPIAVVAIFRRLKVPRTLATIVECESLFNDAVAVVLYRAVLLVIADGIHPEAIGRVAVSSLAGAAGGVALGIVFAFAVARLLRRRAGDVLQILATLLCAYGSYFLAEYLHLSSIFAAITCGIALRYFERSWITLTIAEEVERFWDIAALVANTLVFFLVGAALHIGIVGQNPLFVIMTIVGLVLSRYVVGGLLLPAGFPREWLDVVRVAGLRSALPLALAIALPPSIPYRASIIGATFAAALATLAFSATVVPAAVSRAGRERRLKRLALP